MGGRETADSRPNRPRTLRRRSGGSPEAPIPGLFPAFDFDQSPPSAAVFPYARPETPTGANDHLLLQCAQRPRRRRHPRCRRRGPHGDAGLRMPWLRAGMRPMRAHHPADHRASHGPRPPGRVLTMSTDAHVLAERQVPRYTSYPTAPHFTSDIGPGTYAAWLAQIPQTEPLSIYFHVPFCKDLCLYCGCHTKAIRKRGPLDAYIDTLKTEIGLVADCTGARQVSQVHWGGGTPSILGGDGLSEVVSSLAARFDLRGIKEHAIKLDPRHVEPPLAHALAGIGVNRASLGVQDFSPDVQQAIGRVQPYEI